MNGNLDYVMGQVNEHLTSIDMRLEKLEKRLEKKISLKPWFAYTTVLFVALGVLITFVGIK